MVVYALTMYSSPFLQVPLHQGTADRKVRMALQLLVKKAVAVRTEPMPTLLVSARLGRG